MENIKKKNRNIKVQTVLKVLFVLIIIGIIYKIFRGQTDEIIEQLRKMTWTTMMALILCSVFFNVIEGLSYYLMGKRCNSEITPVQGVGCSYYCGFFKLSTLGSGTAAAGMVYLNRYHVEPSESFGMITVNYILQKISIVVICLIGFALNYSDMQKYYHEYFKYIIPGIILTIFYAILLLMVILWGRFHQFLIFLTDKVVKKESLRVKIEGFKNQLLSVRGESHEMMQDKSFLCKMFLLNMLKFMGWYMIPCVVLGYSDIRSIQFGISVSALASSLIGVIPSPGATGSTEAVFYALFSVITQDIKAVAIMLLYRCFTYIFPFIIGTILILTHKIHNFVKPAVDKEN